MREQFLAAIAAEPYESIHHVAYADWLEENGHDDEAAVQRAWTPQKQRDAEAFMEKYVGSIKDKWMEGRWEDDYRIPHSGSPPTRDDLFAVAEQQLADPRGWHVLKIPFHEPKFIDGEADAAFWRHYSTLTGRVVPEDECGSIVFCSC